MKDCSGFNICSNGYVLFTSLNNECKKKFKSLFEQESKPRNPLDTFLCMEPNSAGRLKQAPLMRTLWCCGHNNHYLWVANKFSSAVMYSTSILVPFSTIYYYSNIHMQKGFTVLQTQEVRNFLENFCLILQKCSYI